MPFIRPYLAALPPFHFLRPPVRCAFPVKGFLSVLTFCFPLPPPMCTPISLRRSQYAVTIGRCHDRMDCSRKAVMQFSQGSSPLIVVDLYVSNVSCVYYLVLCLWAADSVWVDARGRGSGSFVCDGSPARCFYEFPLGRASCILSSLDPGDL